MSEIDEWRSVRGERGGTAEQERRIFFFSESNELEGEEEKHDV